MNRQPEEEEDDYRESEDEDYNPDAPVGSSDEESDAEDKKLEATYSKYQGTGGFIKTRAQRRAEAEGRLPPSREPQSEAKPVVGQTSIDVDSLWAEMNSTTQPSAPAKPAEGGGMNDGEYITIERTFKFAGEVKTETKRVLRFSAEGQNYLREQKEKAREAEEEKAKAAEKAQAKAETSTGAASSENSDESGTTQAKSASPESNGEEPKLRAKGRGPVKRKMSLMEEYQMNKAKKINTLEKSRLDWLGFVDKEGINEDLKKHNKGGYLDKQNFLDRVDQKVERDLRQQRAAKKF